MSELEKKLREELGLVDSDFGYYATDLYVRATDEVVLWLKKNFQFFTNVTMFQDCEDNTLWLDVPFQGRWKNMEQVVS